MISKIIKYCFCVLLLSPYGSSGQVIDTVTELKQLVSNLKTLRNMEYDYISDVEFPNGDKDHLKGVVCIDNDELFFYNDCNAYTMIYTKRWLYKADHRNKTLYISDLNKEKDKKLKQETEKSLFQSTAIAQFLDSVVLRSAFINNIKKQDGVVSISLGFPKSATVQKIDLVYNMNTNLLVSYDMIVAQPWQRTPKGIQVIEATIKCNDFRKVTDRHVYDETNFFSYTNNKLGLKKYDNYKLSTKL